ncbi:MAG TPA: HPP family protein [Acidobacteriaceae bacterium]
MKKRELVIAPAGEALLILLAGTAGWAVHQPMIFASLGPTAYELIETPHRRSAEPYSIVVGHAVGVGAGFLALWLTGAWGAAPVSATSLPLDRVWCATLAAGLTVLGNLLLRASQPAAIASALLIAVGIMQRPLDALVLMGSVVLMTIVGEPLRRLRLRRGKLEKPDER